MSKMTEERTEPFFGHLFVKIVPYGSKTIRNGIQTTGFGIFSIGSYDFFHG